MMSFEFLVSNTDTLAVNTEVKPTAKPASKADSKPASKATSKSVSPATPKPAKESELKPTVQSPAPAAPKVADTPAVKAIKPKKAKLVRDSFTMPESEYQLIAAVKKRCIAKGIAVKKSEVLRAAITVFAAQSDAAITQALQSLEVIKTGRPPKGQK